MRHALGVRSLPQCQAPRPGWLGHLRAWLSDREDRKRIAALERFSPHLLRDIGLAHDLRLIDSLEERR